MRHVELLPAFATGIAVAFARLRWVVLSQWRCKTCEQSHLQCACKPSWLKMLL